MLKIETKDYDSPSTRRTIVDLEDAFCGSAIIYNPIGTKGEIMDQAVNKEFTNEWDAPNWDGFPANEQQGV